MGLGCGVLNAHVFVKVYLYDVNRDADGVVFHPVLVLSVECNGCVESCFKIISGGYCTVRD